MPVKQELRSAVKAVEKHGTKAEAARQLGIATSTLKTRLSAAEREGMSPKASSPRTNRDTERLRQKEKDARTEVQRLKRELKAKDQQVERLEQSLERTRKAKSQKWFVPTGKKSKSQKGDFCRLIVPDTHGMFGEKDAIAAMLSDAKDLNPAEVVLLGDHLDCSGFLAQHHVLNYQAELEYSYEQDIEACNTFLDQLQESTSNGVKHYLAGNHEARVSKWIISATLRNKADSRMLTRLLSPESVLSLEKRGINYYPQSKMHMGIRTRGTIKLGHCYFTHGTNHAKQCSAKHVQQFAGCVVHGHVHREQSDMIAPVAVGTVGAWCPGCLCQLQPLYKHTDPSNWTHGYAVQLVRKDGSFLHINVPVIDGTSYLKPLIKVAT